MTPQTVLDPLAEAERPTPLAWAGRATYGTRPVNVLLSSYPAAGFARSDWFGVGLVMAILGGFLLANSILFRHPRTLVEDFFRRSSRRLSSIREYIFHRVQVHLGFLFLLCGFGLQLYGHYRAPLDPSAAPAFPTPWVGVILLLVVALELLGWWLSHWLFRRYVREHFLEHPPNLEADMDLARELGELFGIQSTGEDSVQSFIARIRRELGLGRAGVRPGAAGRPASVFFEQEEREVEEPA